MYYTITNLLNAKNLADKMRRWSQSNGGYAASVTKRGNCIIVEKEKQPWAELAGHITNATQIYPCNTFEKAKEYVE